jgi:broad specificity phosphatase PhoE
MQKLILIKHAEPQKDPALPPDQWGLSDEGRRRCGVLAERIAPLEPRVIVTSEEPKAVETGQILAERIGVATRPAAGLQEHDRHNVPLMAPREFISYIELFFRRPSELVLGEETAEQAEGRIVNAIDAVLATERQQTGGEATIAIVTHGTVLSLFLAAKARQDPFRLWRSMGLPSYAVLSLPGWELLELVDRVV